MCGCDLRDVSVVDLCDVCDVYVYVRGMCGACTEACVSVGEGTMKARVSVLG